MGLHGVTLCLWLACHQIVKISDQLEKVMCGGWRDGALANLIKEPTRCRSQHPQVPHNHL